MPYFCLRPGKIESRKMLDLQKKYAIISNIFQVQHQASYVQFWDLGSNRNILCNPRKTYFKNIQIPLKVSPI
jgi:hypothetical protein